MVEGRMDGAMVYDTTLCSSAKAVQWPAGVDLTRSQVSVTLFRIYSNLRSSIMISHISLTISTDYPTLEEAGEIISVGMLKRCLTLLIKVSAHAPKYDDLTTQSHSSLPQNTLLRTKKEEIQDKYHKDLTAIFDYRNLSCIHSNLEVALSLTHSHSLLYNFYKRAIPTCSL